MKVLSKNEELQKKKNASRQKRKLILLEARLKQLCAAGPVTIEGERGEFNYMFNAETLANVRDLKRHTGLSQAQAHSLKKYDAAVLMLYPQPRRLVNDSPSVIKAPMWECEDPISDAKMKIDVFTFAEYIGFERSYARYILDHEYAGKLPTYTSFCMSANDATTFVAEHGGLYFLYQYRHMGEPDKASTVVTRSTVAIRSNVPYMFSRTDEPVGIRNRRVRCKINVPIFDDSDSDSTPMPNKYDGFVTPTGKWWQWLVQARPSKDCENDQGGLLVMYTQASGLKHDYFVANGIALTQQNNRHMSPQISRIVLVRHPNYTVKEIASPTAIPVDDSTPSSQNKKRSKATTGDEERKNKSKKLPPYLETYFAVRTTSGDIAEPDVERAFMREKLGLIDPAPNRKPEGDAVIQEMDRIALDQLFVSACNHSLNFEL